LTELELELGLLGLKLCSLGAGTYPCPSSPVDNGNVIYFIKEVPNKPGRSTSEMEEEN